VARKLKYDYPLVSVQWTDAETTYGWESNEETDDELPIVTTVGFLIKDTVDANGHGLLVIASTTGGSMTNSRIKVPKNMIVSTHFLYQPKGNKVKEDTEKLNKEIVGAFVNLSEGV
jgi:hypothetical protein